MGKKDRNEQKILDVDARMQGTMVFHDPVNLKINGNFDGKLDTKGLLTIGETAIVTADINGEEIIIGGKVTGNITALKSLKILSNAHIVGDIVTPVLAVETGAIIQGECQMLNSPAQKERVMNVNELAEYLKVDTNNVLKWASTGNIPAFKEGAEWMFDRNLIDQWIAKENTK